MVFIFPVLFLSFAMWQFGGVMYLEYFLYLLGIYNSLSSLHLKWGFHKNSYNNKSSIDDNLPLNAKENKNKKPYNSTATSLCHRFQDLFLFVLGIYYTIFVVIVFGNNVPFNFDSRVESDFCTIIIVSNYFLSLCIYLFQWNLYIHVVLRSYSVSFTFQLTNSLYQLFCDSLRVIYSLRFGLGTLHLLIIFRGYFHWAPIFGW